MGGGSRKQRGEEGAASRGCLRLCVELIPLRITRKIGESWRRQLIQHLGLAGPLS